ncbi:MAG: hypothetical protein WC663_04350 [Patescibacteria group bacterium]|jgi:hypothetical protein
MKTKTWDEMTDHEKLIYVYRKNRKDLNDVEMQFEREYGSRFNPLIHSNFGQLG